mmetsp:Transcript_1760/g.2442  ORF Transcript_1760/g.2442 Transcript_1760/m.2442 type:complete len:1420 (-) Transcript_1760:1101-5360(-)
MTTLEAIGFTFAGGSIFFFGTLACFGCAVKKRNVNIAPRCAARHPDTIYNPGASNTKKAVQYRGNPWTGWIWWTLGLSYDTMIRGIPGTGTRRGGLEGSMLTVNLDGVVLFKFHALCLKVSALATVLCICIILPINLTARCYNTDVSECLVQGSYNLTNYEKTTLANIPPLVFESDNETNIRSVIWGSTYPELLIRLYVIVFCSWAVTVFTCKLLANEWVEALAMRRVYYLESDIWEKRKEELRETLLKDGNDDGTVDGKSDADDLEAGHRHQRSNGGREHAKAESFRDDSITDFRNGKSVRLRKRSSIVDSSKNGKRRDPWIPHPEQRDTVPNIELYSVLVGGLPSLPSEVVDEQDMEQAALGFSRRQSIDWQLAVATTFFDHCVPNQPGYSSSVAAVTILPDAPELARAWRRWYAAAAAVRRLRFIRSLIAERRHYDIVVDDDGESNMEGLDNYSVTPSVASTAEGGANQVKAPSFSFSTKIKSIGMSMINEHSTAGITSTSENDTKAIYLDAERRMAYYRSVFGASDDEDVERHLYQALDYGPEQSAQYSREAAQGAASCCPNGCGEERLRQLPIDELIEMEEEAFKKVQEANVNLRYAQAQAAVSIMDTDHPKMHLPEKGNSEDIVQHAEEDQKHAKMNSIGANFYNFNRRASTEPVLRVEDSKIDSFADSLPHHIQNASLDCVKLPEDLALENQLVARYNKSTSPKDSADNSHWSDSNLNGKGEHRRGASYFDMGTNSHSCSSSKDETHVRRCSAPASPTDPSNLMDHVSPFPRHTYGANAGQYEMSRRTDHVTGLESKNDQSLPQPPQINPKYIHNSGNLKPPVPPGPSMDQVPPVYTSRDSSHPLLAGNNKSDHRASGNNGPASRIQHSNSAVPLDRTISNGAASIPRTASSLSTNTAYDKRKSQANTPLSFRKQSAATRQTIAMTSEGKIQFVEDLIDYNADEESNIYSPQVRSDLQRSRSYRGSSIRNLPTDDDGWSVSGEKESHISLHDNYTPRRRANTAESTMGQSSQWAQVEQIIADESNTHSKAHTPSGQRSSASSGIWQPLTMPSMRDVAEGAKKKFNNFLKWATTKTTDVVDDLARDSTFAVVTFTSRQAAVAARHCLADGRGADRWLSNPTLPVPPLADSAPCDIITCRGCCRPVTLSLNEKQKMVRKYATWGILATLYIFYTFPITLAASLADPEKLFEIVPSFKNMAEKSVLFNKLLSGIVPALLYTLFFSLCPVIFKAISNFSSNSESQQVAEHYALKYYWWFMVVTAFSGSNLFLLTLNAINEKELSGTQITDVLGTIARTIPTQISATWLNWIVVRLTITLPLQYMIQMNTHGFEALGCKCCARCVKGGGPGGPVPYRIYIDSGVVLLCTFALAPASPIVAPCAFFYFLYCQPLWRRNCIFLYRPKFDSGGLKWPFFV